MNVLVTGGLGFIGSHVTDLLVEEGHDVTVIDNLSTGDIRYLNRKADLVKADITNEKLVHKLMRGVDWVFHLAGLPRIQRSIADPVGTHKANVTGTLCLLSAAKDAKVKKFVYSSSSSVYGVHDTPVMKEGMDCRPTSPYAMQKHMGEQYCTIFKEMFDVPTIILRYFNVWGSRASMEGAYCLVLGKFIRQNEKGEKITIYGDGTNTRSYVHVKDVAMANLLAVSKMTDEYIFNIGTKREISVNQMAELVGGESDHIIPSPREFEEKHKSADFSLAKKELGWEPTIYLDKDFKKYL